MIALSAMGAFRRSGPKRFASPRDHMNAPP
jgi:hypothetical protein